MNEPMTNKQLLELDIIKMHDGKLHMEIPSNDVRSILKTGTYGDTMLSTESRWIVIKHSWFSALKSGCPSNILCRIKATIEKYNPDMPLLKYHYECLDDMDIE